MKRFLFHPLAMLAIIACFVAGPSAAQQKPGRGDQIRDVIQSQLKAFRQDDGAGAYRHASPMIRMMFPDPGRFMQMVQRAYRPVYRASNIEFRRFGARGGRVVQELHLTGPDGARYAAYYFMQQQTDGSWKINGVRLVKLPGAV